MRAVFVLAGVALAAAIGVAGAGFGAGRDAGALPQSAGGPGTAPLAAAAPAPCVFPVAAEAAPKAPERVDAAATWRLPDGSCIAPLNGAIDPAPLAWPPNVPWSPIVGRELGAAGVEWYVHADGSRSTTETKWRADLGRFDAVTRLARPGPSAPASPTAPPAAAR